MPRTTRKRSHATKSLENRCVRSEETKPKTRAPKPLPFYLTAEEIDGVLAGVERMSRFPRPDARMVMLIMWRGGLRIAEALALTRDDLNLTESPPTMRVNGKGQKALLEIAAAS